MRIFEKRLRLVGLVFAGAVLLAVAAPVAVQAIGCDSDQSVTVLDIGLANMDPNSGQITSGIFVGDAVKVGTGLLYDTFSFEAYDIVSGMLISGTYQVSTFNCFLQQVTNSPVPATHLEYAVINQ